VSLDLFLKSLENRALEAGEKRERRELEVGEEGGEKMSGSEVVMNEESSEMLSGK
jgi:hypothetical protein